MCGACIESPKCTHFACPRWDVHLPTNCSTKVSKTGYLCKEGRCTTRPVLGTRGARFMSSAGGRDVALQKVVGRTSFSEDSFDIILDRLPDRLGA